MSRHYGQETSLLPPDGNRTTIHRLSRLWSSHYPYDRLRSPHTFCQKSIEFAAHDLRQQAKHVSGQQWDSNMASRTTRCWEVHQSVLKALVIITKTILPFVAKRSCSEWQTIKVNGHDTVSRQHRHRAQEGSMSQARVGLTVTVWGYHWGRYCDLKSYGIWRRVVWHIFSNVSDDPASSSSSTKSIIRSTKHHLHCGAVKLETWSNFKLFHSLKPEQQSDSASLFQWYFDFGNCMTFFEGHAFSNDRPSGKTRSFGKILEVWHSAMW
jgi:hypothetical protein